jgi:hypothetical protein
MSKKYKVTVTQEIEVELFEDKFTDEFLSGFKETMYNFDDLKSHAKHIGQHFARFYDCNPEGYYEEDADHVDNDKRMFSCDDIDTQTEIEECF